MLRMSVNISRYVDGSSPGWVECTLVDAYASLVRGQSQRLQRGAGPGYGVPRPSRLIDTNRQNWTIGAGLQRAGCCVTPTPSDRLTSGTGWNWTPACAP